MATSYVNDLMGLGMPPQLAALLASPPITNAAMATWFAALPTTLPGTAGQPWNNGGVLSFS